MRIVALETSDLAGSVAAMDGPQVVAQVDLPTDRRSAQTLAPALAELWQRAGWRADQTQLVAVTAGPGSFTGLRVGITTAKMLAYVARAAVLGIDTLEVIAAQAPAAVDTLWAVLDAQRGQLVVRPFQRDADRVMIAAGEMTLQDIDPWLAGLPPGSALSGPILRKLASRIPATLQTVDATLWMPTAVTVGQLAWHHYQAGRRDDLWQLAPRYSRRAAAEEKLFP